MNILDIFRSPEQIEDRAERHESEKYAQAKLLQEFGKTLQRLSGNKLRSDAYFEGFIQDGYPTSHPDPLIRRKDLGIYVEMYKMDDMVSSGVSHLLLATIAPGLEWESGDDSDEQAIKARDMQIANFEHMLNTPTQLCINVGMAAPMGFSVQEPLFEKQLVQEGDFAGMRFWKKIVPKGIEQIGFKTDDFNEIEEDGIWQYNYSSDAGTWTQVDLEDVLYHVHWPIDNSPYGTALIQPAWGWFVIKKVVMKSWGRFIEHYGVPRPHVQVDDNVWGNAKSTFLAKIRKVVRDAAAKNYLITPKSAELGFMDSKIDSSGKSDTFEAAMATCNRALARCMRNPSLLGEDSQHGTRAMAETQTVDQFGWQLEYLGSEEMDAIHRQLTLPSHLHNFPASVPAPRLKIKSHKQKNLLIMAQVREILSKMGVSYSESSIRREFDLEAPAEGEPVVGGREFQGPLPPGVTEQGRREAVEIALEIAHKKFKLDPTFYSFGGSEKDAFKLSDDQLKKIDSGVDYKETDRQAEIATELYTLRAGLALEEIEEATQTDLGKS